MASTKITSIRKGVIAVVDSNDGELNQSAILSSIRRDDDSYGNDSDWGCDFVFTVNSTSSSSSYVYTSYINFGIDSYNTYSLGSVRDENTQAQDYQPGVNSTGGIRSQDTYKCSSSHIGTEDAGYKFQGFVLYFVDDTTHAITSSNNNYICFAHKAELELIDWSQWVEGSTFPYYEVCVSPVYTYTAPVTGHLELRYASPIVINRSPDSNTATHIIKSEGYGSNVFLKNQPGFLYYLEEDDDGIYSSYEEQEQETVSGGKELVKVVKVPSNQYLASQDYGVVVTGGATGDSETAVLSKDSSNSMTIGDSWKEELDGASAGIKFIVDLLGGELDTFTRLDDTKAYKFLGICVYYTTGNFETGYTHKGGSDRCYFISKDNFDAAGQVTFTILYRGSSDDVLTATEGVLHLAPVFEAQREVYLTEPIVVKNFPSFTNITDLGNFGKDTSIPIDSSGNIEFGYTDGIQNGSIFMDNFSGLSDHNEYFNPPVSVDAGFVELFGSWSGHVSGAWKQNMTSNGSFVSQTYLGWNQTSYDKDSQRPFTIHTTYINTAETDNNSLYLYIHGTCSDSNIVPPSYSEGMTVQDYQANCNGYEMIGFVVYFKEEADLDDIEKWRDPSDDLSYASYFTPILWDGSSFSAKIKIDLYGENTLNDIPFENYLAISPVYLKTDTKTITLGYAQDSTGGDLSDYVSTYTLNVTIGDTTKQYSQGDSIEVSEGDTITITYSSAAVSGDYTYVGSFAIGGKTYSDGTSIEYDDLEDGDEFHPIFSYSGETFTFKNDTARSIKVAFNGSTTSTQIGPWEETEFMGSSPVSCNISILTPSNGYIEAYDGVYGENAYDLISSNGSFWNNSGNSSNTTQYQANLYVSVPSKGIDIYKLDFYQGNGSCSVLTNSDSDVAVRFVALPWDSQSAETYHLSQFINSLEDEDFKEFYLRGKLPMNLNVISYSSNKKFKSMKCETAHVVPVESNGETNEPSHDLQDIYIRENVGFNVYYIDKVSDIDSIRDTWVKNDNLADETNGDSNTLANTVAAGNGTYDEYGVFTGNGVYNFIIKGSEINAEDKSTYDYEIYNCGPLVGYVEEQDSNTPIDDEDEFFLGVTQPGSEVVTAFGWETVEGERQLMTLTEYNNTEKDGVIERPFYAPNIINPGSWSDSNGTYNDDPAGSNYTTTENEVTGSLMSMEEMPKDYCAFQTGNQFIQFRLRNPYDGSVLNFDEKSAYTVNKGVWQRNVSTTTGTENETMLSDTTHEQTNFLTLWEQRSLFNALNGKPTYVNEVISYNTYNEKDLEDMALNADTASADNGATGSGSTDGNYCFPDTVWYDAYLKGVYGLRDEHGNIVTPLDGDPDDPKPNPDYQPDEDIEFIIPARNGRKAGRALVDNIDDWVQWYKREETAGVIAGGNTSAPGGTPVMFVGPLLNKEKELCIESDATRSNLTLGPGESITVPIVVLYKCYEADGRDSCKYTVGFDLRNSQYQDPLYYEFTCSARYAASVTDTVSSQKASVNSNVKYNVTVR